MKNMKQQVIVFFIGIGLLVTLFPACVNDNTETIDSKGDLPQIHAVSVIPSTVNSDTITIQEIRLPTDTLTIPLLIQAIVHSNLSDDAIENVQYSIMGATTDFFIVNGVLKNNGVYPDISAHDSIYTVLVNISFIRAFVGYFQVEIKALSKKGYSSTKYIQNVSVVRQNRPPVISDLEMPDTVDANASEKRFRVTLKVTDPDGAPDILMVYRQTLAGNKYYLNDKGLNGDYIPNDGIYTETIAWTNPEDPKSDVYVFRAIDRSLDTSNIIVRPIYVKR